MHLQYALTLLLQRAAIQISPTLLCSRLSSPSGLRCRGRVSVAFSLDGTWRHVDVDDRSERRTACAAFRHDGRVFGGRIEASEGEDNNLDNLAEQRARSATRVDSEHSRRASVMVTMDATSPVTAYRRFCKVLNRKKQAYYLTLYAYIRYYYTAGSIDDTRHVVPRT